MPYTDVDVDITVSKISSYDDLKISSYDDLMNKPSINDVVLEGSLTSEDLKLQPAGNYVTVEQQAEQLDKKQNKLTAGANITISEDNVISSTGGGAGGTSNYTDLMNKPSINNVELTGNKTLSDLGIQASGDYLTTSAASSTYATKTDFDNTADDLALVTNQVGAQGESLNELSTAVTELNNTKADKTQIENVYNKENLLGSNDIVFDEIIEGYGINDNTYMYLKMNENLQDSSFNASTFTSPSDTVNYVDAKFNKGLYTSPSRTLTFKNSKMNDSQVYAIDFWFKLPKLNSNITIALGNDTDSEIVFDFFSILYQYNEASDANAIFLMIQNNNNEYVNYAGYLSAGFINETDWNRVVFGKRVDTNGAVYAYGLLNDSMLFNKTVTNPFSNASFNTVRLISYESNKEGDNYLFNIDNLRIQNDYILYGTTTEEYTPEIHTGKFELLKGNTIPSKNGTNTFTGYNSFQQPITVYSGLNITSYQGTPYIHTRGDVRDVEGSPDAGTYVTLGNIRRSEINTKVNTTEQTTDLTLLAEYNMADLNSGAGIKITGGSDATKNGVSLVKAKPVDGDNSDKIPTTSWVNENSVMLNGEQRINGLKHFNDGIDLAIGKECMVGNGTIVFKFDGSRLLMGAPTDNLTIRSVAEVKINRRGTDYDNVDSGNISEFLPSDVVKSDEITKIKKLTQAEYDALSTKDETTFYVIVG